MTPRPHDDHDDHAALEALQHHAHDDNDHIHEDDHDGHNLEAMKMLEKHDHEIHDENHSTHSTTPEYFVCKVDGVTTTEIHRLSPEELAALGPGPLRFSHENERAISEQIASLTDEERKCFEALKSKWIEHFPEKPFSDEKYLRFARCSPGRHKFNEKTAWHVMERFQRRYLTLSAARLESQLLSKTLFPIPGLQTKDGHDVFYMRPSRYFPHETSTKQIIDNLVYCMTTMVEKEKACVEGIGFLANMDDWKMKNFGIDYCLQFMKTLQGRVPCRVRLFLIVNPPAWFGKVWAIMKPMLSKDFREKVHMIEESELEKYLSPASFQDYLPDDMKTGKAPTDDMVHDFLAYRKFVEASKHKD